MWHERYNYSSGANLYQKGQGGVEAPSRQWSDTGHLKKEEYIKSTQVQKQGTIKSNSALLPANKNHDKWSLKKCVVLKVMNYIEKAFVAVNIELYKAD